MRASSLAGAVGVVVAAGGAIAAPAALVVPAALVAIAVVATPADASPLSDALARHTAADVTMLRAQRTDVAARCTLGAIYARRNDLPRAALYLTGCEDAALPDDIAGPVRAALRDTKRRLDASRYSAVAVLTRPEGLTVEIDALPGESFTTPATIWIPPGDHQLRATVGERTVTQPITTEPHKNASVLIDTAPAAKPAAPRQASIDFAVDEPGGSLGENLSAPPPDIKHPSLLSDKYRGVASPSAEASLDDPLAAHPSGVAATERPLWLGARIGIGMFDDTQASARAGFALAAAARVRLTPATFVAARADWTRRGGDASGAMSTTIDTLGASAGLGVTVVGRPPHPLRPAPASSHVPASESTAPGSTAPGSTAPESTRSRRRLALAVIALLRADVRLADVRAEMPVRRTGLSFAAGAELALPATPFTVGLRFEQGLTDLVAGSRDRALLAEIGIDLR
ncbi:MAG TPA: hypothetical protein VLM79_29980 [Kofleriaceae bacterium]|nr:hypothetical protein [Kofleriaceae bacterium]